MKLTTFNIPHHHIQIKQHAIVFRHHWQGDEVYWIVPMIYVITCKLQRDGETWLVRITEDYFKVNAQKIA